MPTGAWLTTNEVAALLRVQPETVRRWRDTGRLPAIAVGPRRLARYAAEDVEKLLTEGAAR